MRRVPRSRAALPRQHVGWRRAILLPEMRVVVLVNAIVLPLAFLYILWYVWVNPARKGMDRFMDFHMYYEAAKGNYSWRPSHVDLMPFVWCYPDYLAWLWKPFALFSWERASLIWHALTLGATMYLLYQLNGMVYGWILVVAFVKPLAVLVWTGNVQPVLLVASLLGPLGAIGASLFKPYYAVFVAWHLFKDQLLVFLGAISPG